MSGKPEPCPRTPNKTQYESWEQARAYARLYENIYGKDGKPYLCERDGCGWWHVRTKGTKSTRRRKAQAKRARVRMEYALSTWESEGGFAR